MIIQKLKKKITKEFEDDLRKAFKEIDKKKDQLLFQKLTLSVKKCLKKMKSNRKSSYGSIKIFEKDIVRTAILKIKKELMAED